MWRLLHVAVIGVLVGSAIYAYSIKYATILYAEKIAKVQHTIAQTHDAIASLRADWARLTRPDRLQAMVVAKLDTQPLALTQIVRASDIPQRGNKVDTIGQTLDTLVTSSIHAPTHAPANAPTHLSAHATAHATAHSTAHPPHASKTAGGATPHAR